MSLRNGDRARFHRLRRRKLLLRKSTRKLRESLAGDPRPAGEPAIKNWMDAAERA
jgi:hypothetical protein